MVKGYELGSIIVESNGKCYVPEEAIQLFVKAFSLKNCQPVKLTGGNFLRLF